MRYLLLAAALASAFARPGAAQQDDAAKDRNECRLAVQVVTTGHPAPHAEWAASRIGSCGAEAGAAVAAAMRQHRTSTDLAALGRLGDVAVVLRDGEMFRAALELLGDPGAGEAARIYAARTLVLGLQPHLYVTYPQLAGGSCYGEIRGADATRARSGAPMPAGFAESAKALGARVGDDTAAPDPVRRAARCVSVHEAAPFEEPVGDGYEILMMDLSIEHVCGNTFRIRNPYEVEMRVLYEAGRSKDTGSVLVPARGETTVTTRTSDPVRLLDEDGEFIATAENTGRPCMQ